MAIVKCLYCDTNNDALQTSGFCDNCGKKLPNSALIKTRRIMTNEGGAGEGEVTQLSLSPTSEALLVAGVVHLVVGGMFLMFGSALVSPVPENFMGVVLGWAFVPSLFLGLLGGLARWGARPAILLACVMTIGWVPLTFLLNAAMAVPWLLVQVVLLGLVARAAFIGLR